MRTLLVALLGGTLLTACQRPPTSVEAPRPVRTFTVSAPTAGVPSVYSGQIRARREDALGFQVSGRIQRRLVEVGTTVKAGTPLLALDARDVALNAAASKAQLDLSRSQWRQSQADHQRIARLADKHYVDRSAFEKSQLALDTAEQSLKAAEANHRVIANQSDYAVLKATAAGVVTAIDAEVGSVVMAGQVVIHVAEDGERELLVSVPESRVEELRAATQLRVALTTEASRDYAAYLRELAPDTDAVTRTYAARIALREPDASIRLGMTAKLILHGDAPAWRRLPLTAVYDTDGTPKVWLVDAQTQRVALHPIEIAAMQKDEVLVSSGLRDGDIVVSAGVPLLHAGQAVRRLQAGGEGGAQK